MRRVARRPCICSTPGAIRLACLRLGQYQTPNKATKITALPDLRALLDVQSCLLTMDTIGCQKNVTRAITIAIAKAEYLLALKGNQPTLHTAVETAFATAATDATDAATTTGEKPAHERVETRTCRVLPADHLPAALRGPERVGLQTLIEVVATRTVSATDVTTTETRHYRSSRQASAADFQACVRWYGSIENRLHWVLDVVFDEDRHHKRAGHLAANCAIIRKFVLNLLRAQPVSKTLSRKRNRCALSNEYRQKCLEF